MAFTFTPGARTPQRCAQQRLDATHVTLRGSGPGGGVFHHMYPVEQGAQSEEVIGDAAPTEILPRIRNCQRDKCPRVSPARFVTHEKGRYFIPQQAGSGRVHTAGAGVVSDVRCP